MTDLVIEQYKQELIKRYCYLYENSEFLLGLYYFNSFKIDDEYALKLQNILLSNNKFEEISEIQYFEDLKKDKKYLKKAKDGLLKYQNKVELPIQTIISIVYDYINNQVKNPRRILECLDEYFRISRYRNDGKVWMSGRKSFWCDIKNYDNFSAIIPIKNIKNNKSVKMKHYQINNFIGAFSDSLEGKDDALHLTEKEKQQIYLQYHDEIPCDLSIKCTNDNTLTRPNNTEPCKSSINVIEEDIFIFQNEFYQFCPNCGYIVNVPKDLLSYGIQERIIERCKQDSNLFRKMYLYSELCALDNKATTNQKRLLKRR